VSKAAVAVPKESFVSSGSNAKAAAVFEFRSLITEDLALDPGVIVPIAVYVLAPTMVQKKIKIRLRAASLKTFMVPPIKISFQFFLTSQF